MDPQDAIDLSQEAIRTCVFVGGPILVVSLLVGLVVSLMQSMTQLHDQSIAFVPKILLMLVAIAVCLPYLADRMIEFTKYSLEKPVVFQSAFSDDADDESEDQDDSHFTFAWQNSSKSKSAPTTSPAPVKPTVPSMPMLRSAQTSTQPQIQSQPNLQPRVASPFALPAFRTANSETGQPPRDPTAETKTF